VKNRLNHGSDRRRKEREGGREMKVERKWKRRERMVAPCRDTLVSRG
jgi:hypothetical protein